MNDKIETSWRWRQQCPPNVGILSHQNTCHNPKDHSFKPSVENQIFCMSVPVLNTYTYIHTYIWTAHSMKQASLYDHNQSQQTYQNLSHWQVKNYNWTMQSLFDVHIEAVTTFSLVIIKSLNFNCTNWQTRAVSKKCTHKSSISYLCNIHGSSSSTTNIYCDRFHKCRSCKVLNLLWHCGWEQKCLALTLYDIKQDL